MLNVLANDNDNNDSIKTCRLKHGKKLVCIHNLSYIQLSNTCFYCFFLQNTLCLIKDTKFIAV